MRLLTVGQYEGAPALLKQPGAWPIARKELPAMSSIPVGLCQCGCGGKTAVSAYSSARPGWVAGQPRSFIKGHNARKQGPLYVVEDRGYETPCWIWQRVLTDGGYGLHYAHGRNYRPAHRVFYEEHIGPIPEGKHLDHQCRVRACVRPDHLEPVTPVENVRRSTLASRITIEIARTIRMSRHTSATELGMRFGVHANYIRRIWRNEIWKEQAAL